MESKRKKYKQKKEGKSILNKYKFGPLGSRGTSEWCSRRDRKLKQN